MSVRQRVEFHVRPLIEQVQDGDGPLGVPATFPGRARVDVEPAIDPVDERSVCVAKNDDVGPGGFDALRQFRGGMEGINDVLKEKAAAKKIDHKGMRQG